PGLRRCWQAVPKRARKPLSPAELPARRKNPLDAAIAEANGGKPIPAWVHHDLRRTCATGMADIGVLPHIIEAVLNHISGHKAGVAGIYNRATYRPEKAEALDRWDKHLSKLVMEQTGHGVKWSKVPSHSHRVHLSLTFTTTGLGI